MPIPVVCSTCRATLPVPEDQAGKKVRCAGCQAVLSVPDRAVAVAAVATPAKRRPPREWDDDIDDGPRKRRAKGNGNGVLYAVIGGVGLMGMMLGGIVVGGYQYFNRAKQPNPVVAQPAEDQPRQLEFDPPPEGGFAPVPDPNVRVARWDQPPAPKMGAVTKAGLVGRYRGRTKIDASSEWPDRKWSVDSAFDGMDHTSWFSSEWPKGEPPNPWLRVTFPENVTVTKVTVRGNREPNWQRGYTVLAGKLELLDASGTVVYSANGSGAINAPDYTFAVPKVSARAVRFTVTKAEVSLTQVAVGEMIVE